MNIYLHPKIDLQSVRFPNPYIFQLEKVLSENFTIINKQFNKIGVLDFFRYFFKTDIFYFNWIENLPQKRGGKVQVVLFCFFLMLVKIFGKKIVWTLHNKHSHDKSKHDWSNLMYRLLMTHANLILTHSKSGIDFIRNKYPNSKSITAYINHPIGELLPKGDNVEKKYDFLIWGSVQPYKGLAEFLKYLKSLPQYTFEVLIVGKCFDINYKKEIVQNLSANITYYDDFFDIARIAQFARESRFILFTYKADSVLSSGALMDSIRMHTMVIGPNEGAFRDMNMYKVVHLYDTYKDIIKIYADHYAEQVCDADLNCLFDENNWCEFQKKISQAINEL